MKRVFKSLLIIICFVTAVSLFSPIRSEASETKSKEKLDIQVIRTVENGLHYVVVLLDGIVILKVEEQ